MLDPATVVEAEPQSRCHLAQHADIEARGGVAAVQIGERVADGVFSACVSWALKKSMTGPPPIDHCSFILYAAEMVDCSSLMEDTGSESGHGVIDFSIF